MSQALRSPRTARGAVRRGGLVPATAQYVLLAGVGIVWVMPLLWLVSSSLKSPDRMFAATPEWIPDDPTAGAYSEALTAYPLWTWLGNSLVVALLTTALGTVLTAFAAYPLARMRFRGRRTVMALVVATFLLPFETLAVPLFLGLSEVGFSDSYFALAVPPAAAAYNVFLFVQFFRGLPVDLEDAAAIDGAGRLRIFLGIILPLSKPVVATVAIFTFTASWNNFFWPLIVTNDDATRTLPVGIATLVGDVGGLDGFPVLIAATVLSTIPAVVFFLLFQRYFVRGISTAGLKG